METECSTEIMYDIKPCQTLYFKLCQMLVHVHKSNVQRFYAVSCRFIHIMCSVIEQGFDALPKGNSFAKKVMSNSPVLKEFAITSTVQATEFSSYTCNLPDRQVNFFLGVPYIPLVGLVKITLEPVHVSYSLLKGEALKLTFNRAAKCY